MTKQSNRPSTKDKLINDGLHVEKVGAEYKLYDADGHLISGGGGGGSTVEVVKQATSGDNVCKITVDSDEYQLQNGVVYSDLPVEGSDSAFTSGGAHILETSLQASIDAKSTVTASAAATTGDTVGTITVDGTAVTLKNGITIDTVRSATSDNPLSNKAIDDMVGSIEDELGSETEAGTIQYKIKQNSDNITTNSAQITANTAAIQANTTAIATKQKLITYGTADPTGGEDGDIYIKYTA